MSTCIYKSFPPVHFVNGPHNTPTTETTSNNRTTACKVQFHIEVSIAIRMRTFFCHLLCAKWQQSTHFDSTTVFALLSHDAFKLSTTISFKYFTYFTQNKHQINKIQYCIAQILYRPYAPTYGHFNFGHVQQTHPVVHACRMHIHVAHWRLCVSVT